MTKEEVIALAGKYNLANEVEDLIETFGYSPDEALEELNID